jgi:hypothetical protein
MRVVLCRDERFAWRRTQAHCNYVLTSYTLTSCFVIQSRHNEHYTIRPLTHTG